jgi:uncharacterized protein YjiS (DUF1127 family)
MLKGHSSEALDGTNRLYRASGNEQALVFLLNDSGIVPENVPLATRSDLRKSGVASDRVNCNEGRLPRPRAWSMVSAFLIEAFAVDGVSVHPAAAILAEDFPIQEKAGPRGNALSAERYESGSLASPAESPKITAAACDRKEDLLIEDDGNPQFDRAPVANRRRSIISNALASLWKAVAIRWTHWRHDKEIEKTIASLAELDDRTLRDIGVRDRSMIWNAARYGRGLWM